MFYVTVRYTRRGDGTALVQPIAYRVWVNPDTADLYQEALANQQS
jgi:hypothetical protein